MTHKKTQEMKEKDALMPLLKELQISSYVCSDKPDARISYEGKEVGVEVVGYHRSEANMKANSALNESLKKYEKIINNRGERGKQITVMMDEDIAVSYRKSDEDLLFREIENSIKGIDEFRRYILFADADLILPPNDNCVVLRSGIAFCQHISVKKLQELIAKKELLLHQYREISQNKSISEYWLVIYLNQYEYDYFVGQPLPTIESEYSRIYLTHLTDGVVRVK